VSHLIRLSILTTHFIKIDLNYFLKILFTKRYYDYQIKEEAMGKACGTMKEVRNPYQILVRKPEGGKTTGRPWHR
jgi:hypothetical protein